MANRPEPPAVIFLTATRHDPKLWQSTVTTVGEDNLQAVAMDYIMKGFSVTLERRG